MKPLYGAILVAFAVATSAVGAESVEPWFGAAIPASGYNPAIPDCGMSAAAVFDAPIEGLKRIGTLAVPKSSDVSESSNASIGFESLDRGLFNPDRCYDALAAAGVKWARVQTMWSRCEKEKCVYDFSVLDSVVDNLTNRGIRPWFCVSFGNTLYMTNCYTGAAVGCVPTLYGEECRAAWCAYVRELAKRYKGKVTHWEIWNESNSPLFWQPSKPNAKEYIELVKLTGGVIRDEIPGVKIGAVTSSPALNGWERDFFELGGAAAIDFWCGHAYGCVPERLRQEQGVATESTDDYVAILRDMRAFIDARGGKHVEIWQGESGFPSWFPANHWLYPNGVCKEGWQSQANQAKWLLRRFITDRRAGIARSSFYQIADISRHYSTSSETRRHPAEHGILNGWTYKPKMSYCAFGNYNALFAMASYDASAKVLLDAPSGAGAPTVATVLRTSDGAPLFAYYAAFDFSLSYTGVCYAARCDAKLAVPSALAPKNPVLVDMLRGGVYDVSSRSESNGTVTFAGLPLVDYPLVLADRHCVKLVASAPVSEVSYESDPQHTGDLFLPAKVTPETPVVLNIHGGGWSAMSRNDAAGVSAFFVENGCAVYSIDYRLASKDAPWPACGDDCLKAAEFILRGGLAVHGLKPSRIWIVGVSAGGHLALWTGLNLRSDQVAGIISVSGIADPIPDAKLHPQRYARLFGGREPSVAEFDSMSIMKLVRKNGPRILLTHAKEDSVVPIESAANFYNACRDVGSGNIAFFQYSAKDESNLGGHAIWRSKFPVRKRLLNCIENEIEHFMGISKADDWEGHSDTGELQEKAQALADLAVKEGMQGALQFCAYKDGKCIVDVWAGTMTTNAGAAKIDGDTLFPIFSTEKPMLATAVHRSAERGKLEYDKPVCEYWPEFRGGGKEKLTVRELIGYRSGLPDCKPGIRWDDFSAMSDWRGMLEWYASSEPQIEPGTKQRYMPKSYGWALGGLLEKAWGRPANDILREQVLIPAGIEKDFYFVCGDDEIPRIATAYNGAAFESMNNDIARRSLLPSAWAVSSARGIAKFYNRLCGFDGQPPLISKSTLDAALKPCRHESDPLPDAEGFKKWHMIFGMGYGLWGESGDISRVFGHGGVGGSEGLCDRSQRLVIGYTCNFDNAQPKLREAFYSLVGMRWRYWKDDVNIQDLQMATVAKGNAASANLVADRIGENMKCAWFKDARFGMFIHWGIYSIPGKGEWSYAVDKYAPGEYEANAKIFNPTSYNPREWAKLAKAAGMKYAVLTSRHHDGFCMFDSHFTNYKVTNSPYGRDAVREFLEAFRAEGLKVGLYHSLPDWTHPGYADTESPECIAGGRKEPHVPTPEQYASFTNLVYNHINQLTTEYGKLDLLFLDYTSRTKADIDYFGRDGILEMVYRNQPQIIVNDRLSYFKDNCRDFDYYTPEICVPNQPQQVKGREVPWETCATMNDNWGYRRTDENWKTPEAIIAGLVGCVSKNGNLLLNVGPTEKGSIPTGAVNILKALADWYAVNGESVTGCGKSDFTPPHGCVYTQKKQSIYCHFLQSPLGDTILPQLKGKVEKITLLRTGKAVEQINHWGFELLKPNEQRIRTRAIRPGDVVKIELRK